MNTAFTKDPNDILDYAVDWSKWLKAGDTIATSTWIVPDGITNTAESNDTTKAIVWLEGGTHGGQYKAVNRINTAQGRQADKTIVIVCQEQ